jgi:DNA-directed RNA polymerase subunit RPC12/RpoP
MKCSVCGKDIEETFLGKIRGNYRREKGVLEVVCSSCSRQMTETTHH